MARKGTTPQELAEALLKEMERNARPIASRSGTNGVRIEVGKQIVEFEIPARLNNRKRDF
jgi:hypothetical protein